MVVAEWRLRRPRAHTHAHSLSHTHFRQLIGTVTGLSRGVFSVNFAPGGHQLAVAGGDAAIRLFDIQRYSVMGGADERVTAPSVISGGAGESKHGGGGGGGAGSSGK